MSYIGIDIGTTGSKAVVFSREGKVVVSYYREYQLLSPQHGWFELDPHVVMAACKEVIAAAVNNAGDDAVRAIGISSQGEAFTALDDKGQYLCNAMISSDARSKEQVKKFTEEFGAERLYKITGHTSATLYSLFKVLWIKEHRPEIFSRIRKLLCMGDLLGYELTGEAVISHNLAARTMMFDVRGRCWSKEILDAIGIDEQMLSRTAHAGDGVGTIGARIADALGIGRDVLVVTGGHDQSCGALGVGAVDAETAAYSIGTVECITPAFSECVLDERMMQSNLATYPHVADGLYTTVAFCTTGGSGLRWFRDNLGMYEMERARQSGEDVYELLLAQMPKEPSGLLVLPHFSATGTPYFDPSPTGAIIGLKLSTSKGEMIKGMLEGITFEAKVNLELLRKSGITVNELRAFGGGVKSAQWMQIKADIFGMPVATVAVSEAGCMGAAMLAAKGCGDVTSLRRCADEWVRAGRTYEPDAKSAGIYRERFDAYQQLYGKLKAIKI